MNTENPVPHLESRDRRKVVKTLVGGVTALAAYNVLPVNWSSPVIEQVFLPAHAATSGGYTIENFAAERRLGDETTETITVKINGTINPALAGQPVNLTIQY